MPWLKCHENLKKKEEGLEDKKDGKDMKSQRKWLGQRQKVMDKAWNERMFCYY